MKNYSRIYILILLTATTGCRSKVDTKFLDQVENENMKWTVAVHKMEMKALEHQMVMSELLDSMETGYPEAMRDSVRRMSNEWNAAFEVVSNRMEEFLDENDAWLAKVRKEGIAREVGETWWKNRQSQFMEIKQEVNGLEALFDEQFRGN